MNKVELQTIANGILQAKFEKAFQRTIENLRDVNTSFKFKRKITITLAFTQNEDRDDVHVDIDVVERLAPQSATTTGYSVGKNLRTGEIYVQEYGKALAGQLEIEDDDGIIVDQATGEVIEDEKIIDYRKAAAK